MGKAPSTISKQLDMLINEIVPARPLPCPDRQVKSLS